MRMVHCRLETVATLTDFLVTLRRRIEQSTGVSAARKALKELRNKQPAATAVVTTVEVEAFNNNKKGMNKSCG